MKETKKSRNLRNLTVNLTIAAICLAMCMVLPFFTGQIPQIGNALSPMHIPVLLCGFLCGPYYAAIIGFIAPLLRFMLFGMPPLLPIGVPMCFELAVYGLVSGLLYQAFPKKTLYVYISLITAMLSGRIIWGIVRALVSRFTGPPFTWELFISGAVLNAIPGIIIHIILIPAIVLALKRTMVLGNEGKVRKL